MVVLLLSGMYSYAQEMLIPLSSRHSVYSDIARCKSIDTLCLQLPFFDDFSDYEGLPDSKRWLSFNAFINKDYAPLPPSVGMATLDALDANGNLYAHASTNLFKADTLASQIIRLDSLTGTLQHKLTPSDSIVLSFFYLPGGWYGNNWELVGDAPSIQDSLFLDFFDGSQWNTVWATPGFNADTTGVRSHWPWKFAAVKIDSICYYNSRFQFRFRNYASLDPNPKSGIAGNCDQWNIDYILLDRNRSVNDSIYRDIAFVEKAPSMLKKYQAMPSIQYRASDMANQLSMSIANRYNQTLASSYAYYVFDSTGTQIGHYDGGFENIVPFFPNGQLQNMAVHCTPPVNFSYPISSLHTTYLVKHIVREGVGGDSRNGNDTITFTQVFDNYYAYDDGIPENGYGLTSSGNHLWLSVRFDLNAEDTLTALDLFFNRTRNGENEGAVFVICVWTCHNGKPSTLLYKGTERLYPEFEGMNRFHRYRLEHPVVVSDTIFVGFEQLSNTFINLGFDRSNDARAYTYYRTGNEWQQSILRGAVMMRPRFGAKALLGGIENNTTTNSFDANVFPNPAHDRITITTECDIRDGLQITLFDFQGRVILQDTMRQDSYTLQLSETAANKGLFIIRLFDPVSGKSVSKKIIVR